MESPLLGVMGKMCSGKDTWATFLVEQFGFDWRGTSDIAREYIVVHHGGEPTRDLVRNICSQLRKMHGPDYLVREALKRLDETKPRVISGLYTVQEAEYIRAAGGKLITITTDEYTLFSRMAQRGREGEPGEKDAFARLINNDLHAKDTDQCLADVMKMADIELSGSIPLTDIEQRRQSVLAAFEALGVSCHA